LTKSGITGGNVRGWGGEGDIWDGDGDGCVGDEEKLVGMGWVLEEQVVPVHLST